MRIAARSFNDSTFRGNLTGLNNPPLKSFWSGLSQTYVAAGPPSLRITEIMYHPMSPPAGGSFTKEEFQFVELMLYILKFLSI